MKGDLAINYFEELDENGAFFLEMDKCRKAIHNPAAVLIHIHHCLKRILDEYSTYLIRE